MKIHNAYEGTLNGIKGVWTEECPEGVVVSREFLYLTADDSDHKLQNKKTKEKVGSVIIEDESEMHNWEEVEREKFPWEKEIKNG